MAFRINNVLFRSAHVKVLKKIAPSLLLLIFIFICFCSQFSMSVTVDEFHHFPSGIYNIKAFDWRMNNESPPLIKCFPALSTIITNPRIDYKSFEKSPNTWAMGYSFMYLNKDRYRSIFQYGRLIIILFGCLLGWLLYRWAKELYGYKGALFALFLYVFNPNIIAHSSLITIDIGASCLIFLSVYCFWKYLMNRDILSIIIAGVALGLAQLAKFTALLLYPIFFIIIIFLILNRNLSGEGRNIDTKESRRINCIGEFFIIILISVIIINAGYFFSTSFRPLSEYYFTSNLLKEVASSFIWQGFPIPLPYDYLSGFDTQMTISAGGVPFYVSYLLGEHSLKGWWYYYIIAFFIKNPEPLFIIFLLSAVIWIGNKRKNPDKITVFCIWVPFMSYLLYFSFFTHIPIGIRYILPMFPFLFLASGYLFNEFTLAHKGIKAMLIILIVSYLFISLSVFPRYLSYFNMVSGGSQNGYRWLIDSNLDWGQSLPSLKKYMDENSINEIKLGYFGRVDPAIYGINYTLAERDPSQGVYAISINFLVGRPYYLLKDNKRELLYIDMNYFDKYRYLKPSAIVDNSIYIFDLREERAEF